MSDNFDIHQTFTEADSDVATPLVLYRGATVAGRYTLVECLGRGGMGEAWLAEQIVERKHESEVAPRFVLKIVPGDVQNDVVEMDKVRESYLRIVGLKHANICTLHPLERDDRLGYVLVMEYVPGTTLRQHVRAKPGNKLDLDEVVRLLMPVAEALDYAHKKKVIHRDIKPANIMVMPDGETQIIDFGLAAQIRTSMSQVSKVRMSTSGTLPYMAPEQWMGELQDARTDQYALGVVAYELLAGRLPFESAEQFALGFQVMNKPVPKIGELVDSVNEALAKAMAKTRNERFESCREFVMALSAKHEKRPVRNDVPTQTPSSTKQSPPSAVRTANSAGSPLKPPNSPQQKTSSTTYTQYDKHNVSIRDSQGNFPLHNAVFRKSADEVKAIIEAGAKLGAKNSEGKTALHVAVQQSDEHCLSILLDKGANVNAVDNDRNTPLLYATSKAIVDKLIKCGADVNFQTRQRDTPLHLAVAAKDSQRVETILKLGADPNRLNNNGKTPLHVALNSFEPIKVKEIITLLLEYRADINFSESYETPFSCLVRTVLHCPLLLDIFRLFIKTGAKLDKRTENHFMNWALGSSPDISPLLKIEQGITCEVLSGIVLLGYENHKKQPFLHLAVARGADILVKQLLEMEVDVNSRDGRRKTPLDYGCDTIISRDKNSKLLEMLLQHGANPNCDYDKEPPLQRLIMHGRVEATELMLKHGADLNAARKTNFGFSGFGVGCSALHAAIASSYLLKKNGEIDIVCRIIELLFKYGARPDKTALNQCRHSLIPTQIRRLIRKHSGISGMIDSWRYRK